MDGVLRMPLNAAIDQAAVPRPEPARSPAARPLRIAIMSVGRLWLCDLARELHALGHAVRFHSVVPPRRTAQFGLPAECARWLGPSLAALYAAVRSLAGTRSWSRANHLLTAAFDRGAARAIEPCDVLIGASQTCLETMEHVRRRFGARVILERGSRHILSQRDILERLPSAPADSRPVPDWIVRRELAEYGLADRIVVPSRHAAQSFVDHGVAPAKLVRNPYGVDLRMFPPTPAPPPGAPPTLIMAGLWCRRKGCEVLVEAWQRMRTQGTRLLHVGKVDDLPLPSMPRFEHVANVDQRRLTEQYARAHVLALASREEGLALVQAQALASGVRVAASDYTGAEDLQEYLDDPRAVAITPVGDVDAFAGALDDQLGAARAARGMRDLLGAARDRLTWTAYAKRYDAMLSSLECGGLPPLRGERGVG
jgi:glycosyltransferase involved in cell wall biosynthesis